MDLIALASLSEIKLLNFDNKFNFLISSYAFILISLEMLGFKSFSKQMQFFLVNESFLFLNTYNIVEATSKKSFDFSLTKLMKVF